LGRFDVLSCVVLTELWTVASNSHTITFRVIAIKKNLSEAMCLVKLSSHILRVFMMTQKNETNTKASVLVFLLLATALTVFWTMNAPFLI